MAILRQKRSLLRVVLVVGLFEEQSFSRHFFIPHFLKTFFGNSVSKNFLSEDSMPPFKGVAERFFIGVLDFAANGQTPSKPRYFHAQRFQKSFEV